MWTLTTSSCGVESLWPCLEPCVWRITDFPRISNSPHTGSDGRPPRRKPGFEKRQVGSIHQRFADLAWLASRSFGTTDAGGVMAVNLKTLDFSPLSEFLLGTGVRLFAFGVVSVKSRA